MMVTGANCTVSRSMALFPLIEWLVLFQNSGCSERGLTTKDNSCCCLYYKQFVPVFELSGDRMSCCFGGEKLGLVGGRGAGGELLYFTSGP